MATHEKRRPACPPLVLLGKVQRTIMKTHFLRGASGFLALAVLALSAEACSSGDVSASRFNEGSGGDSAGSGGGNPGGSTNTSGSTNTGGSGTITVGNYDPDAGNEDCSEEA